MVLYGCNCVGEFCGKPFYRKAGRCSLGFGGIHLPAFHKTVTVPYLVAECGALLDLGFIVEDVVAGAGAKEHAYSHCIGPVFLNEVKRVGAVAKGL